MHKICSHCGSLNSEVEDIEKGRSVLLFLILCFFAIIPGLLYWGFAKKSKIKKKCSGCNMENTLINIDTPKGKEILNQYHPNLTLQMDIKTKRKIFGIEF